MFCKKLLKATSEPQLCTISELLVEMEINESSLLRDCEKLSEILEHWELELSPPIGEYDHNYERVLSADVNGKNFSNRIENYINQGENEKIELKSSVRIDTNKKKHNPNFSNQKCVSDQLFKKVAQEIAALMNSDGGVIIFGVNDDGVILGCEPDFETYSHGGSPSDKADLMIKELIMKSFDQAEIVYSRVKVECGLVRGKYVILLSVMVRGKLSYLKRSFPSRLYLRLGTSAMPIDLSDIEDYFEITPKFK